MKKKEKKLLLVIIILVFTIILLCFLIKKVKNTTIYSINKNEDYGEDDGIGLVIDKKFKKLENEYTMYFTVKNILGTYIQYFEKINGDVAFEKGRMQISDSELKEKRKNEGFDAIKSLFDAQYNEKTKTNEQLIINEIQKYKNSSGNAEYSKVIDEIYMCNLDENIVLVLVYSKINNIPFNCIIKIDAQNNRYSIFWEDYLNRNNYNKDRTEEISIEKNIEKNDYNYCTIIDASSNFIAVQYFQDLKDKMMNNPKELYTLLDENYKNKKFSNYDTYKSYLENNKERISKSDIKKYKFENNYIYIADNYDNIYSFYIKEVMKYMVKLDDYTIEDNYTIEKYNKLSDTDKVNANIQKFLKMINLKDYQSAYNVLDETFKKENYQSVDIFEKTIKSILFDYTKIGNIKQINKSGNYYIVSLDVQNGEKIEEVSRQMTIIMQLLEGTNFVMSYSMN